MFHPTLGDSLPRVRCHEEWERYKYLRLVQNSVYGGLELVLDIDEQILVKPHIAVHGVPCRLRKTGDKRLTACSKHHSVGNDIRDMDR